MGYATRESGGERWWRLSNSVEIKRDAASWDAGSHLIDFGDSTRSLFSLV